MIAVIDVGSNSVRLMLWADGKTLYKRVCTTRLGEGLMQTKRLSAQAMLRTVDAVEELCLQAKDAGASKIYAFATAAVRSAQNGRAFCDAVLARTRLAVDVLSGEQEALLAVRGALGNSDGAVIDVGGASSEVSVIDGGKRCYSHSFPVGAVTLREMSADKKDRAFSHVSRLFEGVPALKNSVYAVGGTASALVCLDLQLEQYSSERVHNHYLSAKTVENLTEKLFSLSVPEREQLPGMVDKRRADILACGACILSAILQKGGAEGVFFSDKDNLEGYLAVRGLK